MNMTYFAADGSYGDAAGLIIIDTSDWDTEEWDHVDQATDRDRARIAREMSENNPDQLQLKFEN